MALDRLLEAGRKAFTVGDRRAAHEYWRMAAVTNPYEERVWVALMNVLTDDEDREVCLENIIAINPLNPEARRALRAVRHAQRVTQEIQQQTVSTPKPGAAAAPDVDDGIVTESEPRRPPRLMLAVVIGVSIGLVAVLLGVIASIAVYGGLIIRAAP